MQMETPVDVVTHLLPLPLSAPPPLSLVRPSVCPSYALLEPSRCRPPARTRIEMMLKISRGSMRRPSAARSHTRRLPTRISAKLLQSERTEGSHKNSLKLHGVGACQPVTFMSTAYMLFWRAFPPQTSLVCVDVFERFRRCCGARAKMGTRRWATQVDRVPEEMRMGVTCKDTMDEEHGMLLADSQLWTSTVACSRLRLSSFGFLD
ncbi:hypothetical protein IWX91DRAFT_331819, partial [Phyllosticta citricarpa]